MKFTVLLLYPDYLADPFGETYLDHVEEDSVEEAKQAAQKQAAWENNVENNTDGYEDFLVLAVFAGHLEDLKHG